MMNMLRACYDRRVITALVAVGAGVVLFAPNLVGAALPLLIVAACPLSIVLMMKTMSGQVQNVTPAVEPQPVDRAQQLRTELAGSRREQQRLVVELEELVAAGSVAVGSAQSPVSAVDLNGGYK